MQSIPFIEAIKRTKAVYLSKLNKGAVFFKYLHEIIQKLMYLHF